MQTATAAPISPNIISPKPPETAQRGVNPNANRYGWCPFEDINLVDSFGCIQYYVQPENSPYHRILPKNQLIPFVTFNKVRYELDTDARSTPGNPNPQRVVNETKTAHEAATEILYSNSGIGFVILNSLEGLNQEDAHRIFAVVQPFDYRLGDIGRELEYADDRIEATDDLVFTVPDGDKYAEYTVEVLRSESEREIARRLRDEMLAGAEIALTLANEVLDKTEASLTTRFSGGKGKAGPDARDRRLSEEMGRDLPKLVGKPKESEAISKVSEKVDFLVDREVSREQKEENERLRRELEEAKAQLAAKNETGQPITESTESSAPVTAPANAIGGKQKAK